VYFLVLLYELLTNAQTYITLRPLSVIFRQNLENWNQLNVVRRVGFTINITYTSRRQQSQLLKLHVYVTHVRQSVKGKVILV